MRQNHPLILDLFTNPIDDQLHTPFWTGLQQGCLPKSETTHLQPAYPPHQIIQKDNSLQALA